MYLCLLSVVEYEIILKKKRSILFVFLEIEIMKKFVQLICF